MSLEFINNPKLVKKKNHVQQFVEELKNHPLCWALLRTSPEKTQYWGNRFSMELGTLKKRFPDVDWHKAETDEAWQIVAWYQPEEE